MIDRSGCFIKCNDATVRLLGAVSKNQIINKPPSYFSPKYQPDNQLSAVKAKEMIRKAYKNGQNEFEWIHKRLDGVLLCIRSNLISVFLHD